MSDQGVENCEKGRGVGELREWSVSACWEARGSSVWLHGGVSGVSGGSRGCPVGGRGWSVGGQWVVSGWLGDGQWVVCGCSVCVKGVLAGL